MTKVAVVQMVSTASVKKNLSQIEQFFMQAKENQAELLTLPENFAFMGMHEHDKLRVAENYGAGEIQAKLSQLASQYNLWVVAGTLALQSVNKKVRSSCLVFDNKGFCAARYDKIHLFDVRVSHQEAHQESLTVERGNEPVLVDTPIGRLGLSICYDLRFPELYQQLVQQGAQLLTVPSAFTAVTGQAHWEVLLRARAIENLAYVIAPNQGGFHENGRHTYGHSMVVNPWGEILAQCGTGTQLVIADIDLQILQKLREQFPSNEHHVLIQ